MAASNYDEFVGQLETFVNGDTRFHEFVLGRGPEVLNNLKVPEGMQSVVMICDDGLYNPIDNTFCFNVEVYVAHNATAAIRTGLTTARAEASELLPLLVEAFGSLVDIPISIPVQENKSGQPFDIYDQNTNAAKYVMVRMSGKFLFKDCNTVSWR